MKTFKGELYLFTTALIWGFAIFVQTTIADQIGSFTFNGIRYLVGAVSLLPLLKFKRSNINNRKCIILGICLGFCLYMACNLQQIAMIYSSSVAKVGFITSLYIVLVPLLSYFIFKTKTSPIIIVAIVIAVIGLYMLCGASLTFELADILLISCAFFYAMQMVLIGGLAKDVNSVQLSFVQYVASGVMSLITAVFFEDIQMASIVSCTGAILYIGIMSTGVAYTLQIMGQRYTSPAVASVILSFEAGVSALAGWIFLNQTLSTNEAIGCALMALAVILAQVRIKEK